MCYEKRNSCGMGDSDEENDRRRAREKFRKERGDYQEKRDGRDKRDDWSERDKGGRRDYDPRSRMELHSPAHRDTSPPAKRMRGDRDIENGITQPPMMTFKQFLASQDDNIESQEAVKKYAKYKEDFKKQQLNDFFISHKDEEWFRLKYHPEESAKRHEELATAQRRRLDVFMELFNKSWVDAVSIDEKNSEQIIRFLDAVVILLEGGTDFDLKCLDEPYKDQKPKESGSFVPITIIKKREAKEDQMELGDEGKKKDASSDSDESDSGDESQCLPEDTSVDRATENGEDRKVGVEGISASTSGGDAEYTPEDDVADYTVEKDDTTVEEDGKESSVIKEDTIEKQEIAKEVCVTKEYSEVKTEKESDECTNDAEGSEALAEKEVLEEPKPKPLHKTFSIFLRNLAPSVRKQEVEAMCQRFPGFLRVAIADPQRERRFMRRAWVTFDRSVNVKNICWDLSSIKLRDKELGAVVNADLSRRIRSVNGISCHKQIARSDIKLAARIIQNLDGQKNLWGDDVQNSTGEECNFLIGSKNPLLKNIKEYLIEESSAEEEELLGIAKPDENVDEDGCAVERDEVLIKVLDRLLLYLRIVHSVDYYNNSEYPSEDEMPNRCGIMHARGSPPSSKVTQQEIDDYIAGFEVKSSCFLQAPQKVEEFIALAKKDPETEVEKFFQVNTQELSTDKWLCLLSGKKFKSPEYVRKHICNKHSEKLEEVKKDVEYFNNYLLDPKRPQLPEHPSSRTPPIRSDVYNMGPPFHSFPGPPYGFGPRGPGFGMQMYRGGNFGRRNFNRQSPRSDSRKHISYRDLDAPPDVDHF